MKTTNLVTVKELCSELVQCKVTPTLKGKIIELAKKARRREGEWLRLHLEDTVK